MFPIEETGSVERGDAKAPSADATLSKPRPERSGADAVAKSSFSNDLAAKPAIALTRNP
jgi:hypothetical protein